MTWFFTDLHRYRQEHEGIESLANDEEWLELVGWRVDDSLRLIADVDFVVAGIIYPAYLRYPHHFPSVPPLVFPRDGTTRWSSHQYGAGGELCLEFGPDNWEPRFTGSDMLRSAHRLLVGESASPDLRIPIPSRHAVTRGQELRSSFTRLLVTKALVQQLEAMQAGSIASGKLHTCIHKECFINVIQGVSFASGATWSDESIPRPILEEAFDRECYVAKVPPDAVVPAMSSLSELRVWLKSFDLELPDCFYFYVAVGTALRGWYVDAKEDKIHTTSFVHPGDDAQRAENENSVLGTRKVAIVGCGSIGSKIAVLLARAGVKDFVLVDDDLLLPENMIRHDLDWREIGTHKVESVARRIELVNPAARCRTRIHRLGGQESTGSFESMLTTLASCDLIVDATADPRVFNVISAVVKTSKKAFLWAEIFGGGFGGLIARHRPGIEPQPQTMRSAIESWFAEQGKPVPRPAGRYEGEGEEGPLVADDADITVIAGNAARLAIDTLISREISLFPKSVYVIGLKAGSVFSQPFETFPLDVEYTLSQDEGVKLDPAEAAKEAMRVLDLLLKSKKDAAPTADENTGAPAG